MQRFTSTRDAKEFLVSKIVAEAQREDVSLSEVERKMLYFPESAWTLPDIANVNEAFDRDYDQEKYEQKSLCLAATSAPMLTKTNRTTSMLGMQPFRPLIKKITTF